ncbi:MAG: ABC transporter substrate-binding protein [Firmicutes bacterium]|nr:ABC transporter substrate-binding protein [Bacillota bacterium]
MKCSGSGKCLFIGILLLSLLILGGCGFAAPEDGSDVSERADLELRTVTDWLGREVSVPEKIDSVVCVNVSALRYTVYLDALDLVAGVEVNEKGVPCTKPFSYLHQDLWETLPVTGNNGETYDEQIIAADPDVIVAYFDEDSAENLQKKTGIPVVTIPHLEGILDEEVFFALQFLGDLYDRQERAEALMDYLGEIRLDIKGRMDNVPEEDRPLVYVAGVPYKGAHGFEGTEANYAPLSLLETPNAADGHGPSGPFDMDPEEVLKLDPDYIFADLQDLDLIREQYAQNPAFYDSFTAVREGRVFSQITFRYNATNTEMALADMYYMGTVLYPEAFCDVDPIAKANEIFEMFLGAEDYYRVLADAGYAFRPVSLCE